MDARAGYHIGYRSRVRRGAPLRGAWIAGLALVGVVVAAAAVRFGGRRPARDFGEPPGPPPKVIRSVPVAADPHGANVLIIVGDDVGVDKVSAMRAHPQAPPTPHIDALAGRGLRFDRAYAHPICSPSRAALLTGRYPSRSGIGGVVHTDEEDVVLPLEEITLAELVQRAPGRPYASSAVGKWHLGSAGGPGGLRHPLEQGFGWYAGVFGNLSYSDPWFEPPTSWFSFFKTVNGETVRREAFVLTDETDDAIARIEAMPEPWLLYLSYHAAHFPYPVPPPWMHVEKGLTAESNDVRRQAATMEAMDYDIGRLMQSMSAEVLARTVVIFVGDNGTAAQATLPPFDFDNAKGTLMEEGVHVPMIIAGPGIPQPGAVTGLVHLVDLFPTVAEIAGVPVSSLVDSRTGAPVVLDGVSLLPYFSDPSRASIRTEVYSERFRGERPPFGEHRRMIRSERYKVGYASAERHRIYDLVSDPLGHTPLEIDQLDAAGQAEVRRLAAVSQAIEASVEAEWSARR